MSKRKKHKAHQPKDVEKAINTAYEKVFNEVFKGEKTDIPQAKRRLINLENSSRYEIFCQKFAQSLAKKQIKYQKNTWKKLYTVAKKEGVIALKTTYTEYQKDVFKKAVNENFKMIKSIPQEVMKVINEKSIEKLINEVAEGKETRGSFEKFLKEKKSKNAKLIARTETAKLQTVIQKERATKLGSVCYIWRTSNDQRVRQSHKDMNGVVVFWKDDQEDKPLLDNMYGNAGEFPNCRCDCDSIVIPNVQLKNSFYNVYNYEKHKIERVSRKDLLEMIEMESN